MKNGLLHTPRGLVRRRDLTLGALLGAVLCVGSLPALSAENSDAQLPVFRVGEAWVRSLATHAPLPQLPAAYRPTQPDVAVAQVELTREGTLLAVSVIDAPSDEVAKALIETLRTWKFSALSSRSEEGRFLGKLFFYFVPTAKGIRVLSAREVLDEERTEGARS